MKYFGLARRSLSAISHMFAGRMRSRPIIFSWSSSLFTCRYAVHFLCTSKDCQWPIWPGEVGLIIVEYSIRWHWRCRCGMRAFIDIYCRIQCCSRVLSKDALCDGMCTDTVLIDGTGELSGIVHINSNTYTGLYTSTYNIYIIGNMIHLLFQSVFLSFISCNHEIGQERVQYYYVFWTLFSGNNAHMTLSCR